MLDHKVKSLFIVWHLKRRDQTHVYETVRMEKNEFFFPVNVNFYSIIYKTYFTFHFFYCPLPLSLSFFFFSGHNQWVTIFFTLLNHHLSTYSKFYEFSEPQQTHTHIYSNDNNERTRKIDVDKESTKLPKKIFELWKVRLRSLHEKSTKKKYYKYVGIYYIQLQTSIQQCIYI